MFLNFKKYKGKVIEYLKFNVIGLSNFIASQIFYLTLFLVFNLDYLLAYTITSVISVIASYFLNSKFTFKNKDYSGKKFSLSILIYVFEYILNFGVIIIFVNVFNFSKILAPIIAPVFSTPPVFFMMRSVIKKKDSNKKFPT